jgi:hypothetical protein
MSSTEQPKDIFALYIQNVDKFFNGVITSQLLTFSKNGFRHLKTTSNQ